MKRANLETGSPYLSELYCSDEDHFQYLADLEEGNVELPPPKQENPYLSETYCSDEDYHKQLQKQKE